MFQAKDEEKNALLPKINNQIIDNKMKRGNYQLHVF